jgi:hypothetical protein
MFVIVRDTQALADLAMMALAVPPIRVLAVRRIQALVVHVILVPEVLAIRGREAVVMTVPMFVNNFREYKIYEN